MIGVGLLVVAIAIGAAVMRDRNKAPEESVRQAIVSTIAAGDLGRTGGTISAEGTLESLEQAELRSQLSAPVTKVAVRIGDRVFAGKTLVVLQGRDIAAQLDQAKAGLKAQEARLREVQKGARAEDISITQTNLDKAKSDLANAYENMPTVLGDAYAKADDAVRKQTDAMFTNDETNSPVLTFHVNDAQVANDIVYLRLVASEQLNALRKEVDGLQGSKDPAQSEQVLASAKTRLVKVRDFLNKASDAVRTQYDLSPQTADLYKMNIATARGEVAGALSALNGQEQALAAYKAAIKQFEDQLALKKEGATGEQLEAQQAVVDQARANVESLEAQYAKTIITAPIAGEIAAVPVRVGELLTPGQSVVSIVNKDGLQVKVFVSDIDTQFIEEGAEATIGDAVKGKVLRVAPSVDKMTRKVEITVLVVDKAPQLVIGQNVSVAIKTRQIATGTGLFMVPMQAMRIAENTAYVYTVNADGIVEERRVVIGRILGETVEVVSGLQADMRIVSIAQEVRAGQKVTVQ